MMDLPKAIRIGYRTYRVEAISHDPLYPVEHMGHHSSSKAVIRVDVTLDRQQVAQTLIHEILHGCWYQADLPDEPEEHAVSVLSHLLAQVMQDNPELISWLSANLLAEPDHQA